MNLDLILLFGLLVSTGLFVLIWIIQILHYPLFTFLSDETFPESMKFHQSRISFVVMPLMLFEVATLLYLCFQSPSLLIFIQAGCVFFIWLSTFYLQVPLHNRLLQEKNSAYIVSLIKGNWIRTWLWTLKFILSFLVYARS